MTEKSENNVVPKGTVKSEPLVKKEREFRKSIREAWTLSDDGKTASLPREKALELAKRLGLEKVEHMINQHQKIVKKLIKQGQLKQTKNGKIYLSDEGKTVAKGALKLHPELKNIANQQPKDRVILHLSKYASSTTRLRLGIRPYSHCTVSLYNEIKVGKKTSEWRDMTPYWIRRLCNRASWNVNDDRVQDLTKFLKVHRAWFVFGYPKGNLPRLETDIITLFYHPQEGKLEIGIAHVKEIA